MLTVGDLAERTGTSTSTLRFWESRGEIPAAVRTPQGLRLWRQADVDLVRDRINKRRNSREAAA